MAEALAAEFDASRLERQQRFCQDRAKAHDTSEDPRRTWHAACAASLIRDAAGFAALRGAGAEASDLFREAGERFARLGLFAGLRLLEFSAEGEGRRWRAQHPRFDRRVAEAMSFDQEGASFEKAPEPGEKLRSSREEETEPFLRAAAAAPRQLLDLYYVLRVEPEASGPTVELRHQVRDMLLRLSEFPVGATEIPMVAYVALLDELAELEPNRESRFRFATRDTFLSIVLRRREQLHAARADKWHWRMLLKPTELIDLDLLALATIVVDRTGTTALLEEVIGDRGELVAMPIKAANLLRTRPPRWQD